MKKMTNALNSGTVLFLGLMATFYGNMAYSQSYNIKNDTFWDTENGEPIYSQGGGIFRFKDPNTNEEKYYLAASLLYGWDSSYAYYLVADDIRGPYQPENNMRRFKGAEDDYAHVTQTGFFVTVKGTEQDTVVYCGDRWAAFAENGLGYNQWCPLSFEGDEPYFNSLNWTINAGTVSLVQVAATTLRTRA